MRDHAMRDLDKIRQKVLIELDNRQLAWAILGFLLVSIGTFTAGVVVGQRLGDRLTLPIVGDEPAADDLLGADGDRRSRSERLAGLSVGTRIVDAELAVSGTVPLPSDPTERARMEAQRQIAQARRAGAAHGVGPVVVAPPDEPAPEAAPLTVVQRDPRREEAAMEGGALERPGYSLEVSAFSSPEPARVVAGHLRTAGHEASVRKVTDERGADLWRVEVGHFADLRTASTFQAEFERSAGYSTVMVAVR